MQVSGSMKQHEISFNLLKVFYTHASFNTTGYNLKYQQDLISFSTAKKKKKSYEIFYLDGILLNILTVGYMDT